MIDLDFKSSVEDIYRLTHSQSFQLLEYMFYNEGLPIYRTVENLHTQVMPIYID